MESNATLFMSQAALASLLTVDDYIAVVEQAFRLQANGGASVPGLLHVDVADGEFHVKAGLLELECPLFAAKVNGRISSGEARLDAPRTRGVILLFDGATGHPVAVMDSTVITRSRTAAATAVAAKYLARPDSAVLTVCGYGVQARAHLEAMKRVLPLRRAFVFGRDVAAAERFAAEASEALALEVVPAPVLAEALSRSDVCVTCTPSARYYIRRDDVPRGMFIAAVGADSPHKQELDPSLLAANRVIVDVLDQSAAVGELHHALELGLLRREDVHAELGQVIIGARSGRSSPDEITIFDSTGTAYQDAAAAGAAYRRALAVGAGTFFDFFAT